MTRMCRTQTTGVLAALTLSALLACKKSPVADPPAALPPGPVQVTWEQSYKLTVTGAKATAMFFMTREPGEPALKLRASFTDFPQGTRVEIAGDSSTIGVGGY